MEKNAHFSLQLITPKQHSQLSRMIWECSFIKFQSRCDFMGRRRNSASFTGSPGGQAGRAARRHELHACLSRGKHSPPPPARLRTPALRELKESYCWGTEAPQRQQEGPASRFGGGLLPPACSTSPRSFFTDTSGDGRGRGCIGQPCRSQRELRGHLDVISRYLCSFFHRCLFHTHRHSNTWCRSW